MNRTSNNAASPSTVSWARLLFGVLALAAMVVIATHLGEGRQLLILLRQIQPMPLLAAVVFQFGTYFCVALMLHRALAHDGERLSILRLLPLALAKQFTNQVLPSVGLNGNLMVIRGLQRRGVGGSRRVGDRLAVLSRRHGGGWIVTGGAVACRPIFFTGNLIAHWERGLWTFHASETAAKRSTVSSPE